MATKTKKEPSKRTAPASRSKTKARPKSKAKAKPKVKAKVKSKVKPKPKVKPKAKAKPKAKTATKGRTKTKPKATKNKKTTAARKTTAAKKNKVKTATRTAPKKKAAAKKAAASKPAAVKPAAVKPAAVKPAAVKPPVKIVIKKAPPKPKTPTPDEARAARKQLAAARAARRRRMKRFRPLLREKHASIVQAYHVARGNTRDTTTSGTEDYIDYAVSSYTREFSLSLTEMEQKQLKLVEEALRRLERGDFGNCLNCASEIPEPRLEVEPWARFCIRCQELEEQGLLDELDLDEDDGSWY